MQLLKIIVANEKKTKKISIKADKREYLDLWEELLLVAPIFI